MPHYTAQMGSAIVLKYLGLQLLITCGWDYSRLMTNVRLADTASPVQQKQYQRFGVFLERQLQMVEKKT